MAPKSFLASCVLFLGLFLRATEAQIGLCYGGMGDNLPSGQDVIAMYKQYNIRRMRLYVPDQAALQALRGSNNEVMLGVSNSDLQSLASSQSNADTWVQNNVLNYRNVNFKYIAVGNEVVAANYEGQFLVPAMWKVQIAINNAGLGRQIKVSTSITFEMMGVSYPPSQGSFKAEEGPVIDPIIKFLLDNQAPILVNMYPYFAYKYNSANIRLEYALFTAKSVAVNDGSLGYQNIFDAMLDSVYFALERKNARGVAESGSVRERVAFWRRFWGLDGQRGDLQQELGPACEGRDSEEGWSDRDLHIRYVRREPEEPRAREALGAFLPKQAAQVLHQPQLEIGIVAIRSLSLIRLLW